MCQQLCSTSFGNPDGPGLYGVQSITAAAQRISDIRDFCADKRVETYSDPVKSFMALCDLAHTTEAVPGWWDSEKMSWFLRNDTLLHMLQMFWENPPGTYKLERDEEEHWTLYSPRDLGGATIDVPVYEAYECLDLVEQAYRNR